MTEKVKYYWYGPGSYGAGDSAVKRGGELPEEIEKDPRFEQWVEDGTVSDECLVSFDAEKISELEKAEQRIIELKEEIRVLKGDLEEVTEQLKKKSKIKDNTQKLKAEIEELKNQLAEKTTKAKK